MLGTSRARVLMFSWLIGDHVEKGGRGGGGNLTVTYILLALIRVALEKKLQLLFKTILHHDALS